ncbi:TRAP transporter substrate-binding protein [Aquimarina sp. AD10]|uniref:TRAP transporter substrate-binding protein n=1 Tax=Aquimarina sp. AD10 TaxID=1714849 RepID=UPI000E4CC1F5|nr:TRAP transporter substrate-binding protein [Aquimarina sp. AD10]AXT60562.1 TRAP transporter substrate-binding protein [Aquimarina sp. AD10]RKN01654.1 DctP family TRAP transporter solute-binding subunit [Aquimarina sp. AD10]
MSIFKNNINRFLFALLSLVLISCNDSENVRVLRLAHILDTKHPVHKSMEILGERLAQKSNGKLQLQIYPSSQLGGERECLELLQIGSLDITKVSAAVLENFIPEYQVFGIPYLFRDRAHAFTALDSHLGENLLTQGQKFRLRGLTFYDAGSRSFYTKKKPIAVPNDLKGEKIRVMKSNMAISMVNQLGGAPTLVSWGELYTALQQGVVDGAENNPPSFYTSKHYEICKYYSLDEHTSIPDVLVIGLDTWERLTAQEKTWLKEASTESKIEQRKLWAASEKESLDAVVKAGVQITRPDKSLFEQKTQEIIATFKDQPEIINLITAIKEMH